MALRNDPRDQERPRRTYTPTLSDQQRQRLRVALKNLRKAHGSWRQLADALDVSVQTLRGISMGRDYGSMFMAMRVANLAGVPVKHLLEGKPVAAGRCPVCGQLMDGVAIETSVNR